jgi:tetratricopeptide (TPR) repeat protein
MADGDAGLPVYRWRADAVVRPLPRPADAAHEADGGFRTLSSPGDLVPAHTTFAWSFHLGLPPDEAASRTRLISCGFCFAAPDAAENGSVFCIAVAPGALIGECPKDVQPDLFSGALDVHVDEGAQWIEREGGGVFLRVRADDDARRFCLVAGSQDVETLRAVALRYLDEASARTIWQREWKKREALVARAVAAGASAELAAAACEMLHAHLRGPREELGSVWSAGRLSGGPVFELSDLLPLVIAWSAIEPAVARQVLASAFDTQGVDGSLAATIEPNGRALDESAPLPAVATATRHWWSREQDPLFLLNLLPRLKAYLEWLNRYLDPQGTGSPAWPRSTAWYGHVFEPQSPAVDATAFLVMEIEAFLELCAAFPAETFDLGELQRLHTALKSTLTRILTERVSEAKDTPEWLVPLLWPGIPESLRKKISAAATAAPRPEPSLQHFVRWLAHQRAHGTPKASASEDAEPSDVVLAALLVARYTGAGPDEAAGASPVSAATGWLDRHRRWVFSAIGSLAAAVLLAFVGYALLKRSLTSSSAETTIGMAQRLYQEGRYEDSLRLYRQFESTSLHLYPIESSIGNCLFRLDRFAEAESYFRRAMARDPQSARPAWNLAVTLYKQGRMAEADEAYRSFAERFGKAYPDFLRRASKARELIAERNPMPSSPQDGDAS